MSVLIIIPFPPKTTVDDIYFGRLQTLVVCWKEKAVENDRVGF